MKNDALPLDVALQRVRKIAPMLRTDVETAIASHALMEATNEVVPRGLTDVESRVARSYAVAQQALALKVSMDLARIFDRSAGYGLERQEKASVPVLAALVQRADVQDALLLEAENWRAGFEHVTPMNDTDHKQTLEAALEMLKVDARTVDRAHCRTAIDNFLTGAARLDVAESTEKGALTRLREFRTHRLAHSLFNREPDNLPRFGDLTLLLGIAKEAVRDASLAIDGRNTDYDDLSADAHKEAEGYATCILHGLRGHTRAI